MICQLCKGAKIIPWVGGVKKTCPDCLGVGAISQTPIIPVVAEPYFEPVAIDNKDIIKPRRGRPKKD